MEKMVQRTNGKLPTGVELHGKSLRVVFSFQGKRHRESLGLSPTKQNIKFAGNKRAAILHEIRVGTFKYSTHFPDSINIIGKPAAKNIQSLVSEYLDIKGVDLRRSTLKKYTSMLGIMASLYGANRSCSTINTRSATHLRAAIIDGRQARTANTYIRTVNSFLVWLKEMSYITDEISMKYVKIPEKEIEPFTIHEVQQAIDSCLEPQHKNLITLLAYTGLRTGEVCALAWEDIDFKAKKMHIRRSTYEDRGLKTPKTDKERFVDLMPPALKALKLQQRLTYLYPAKEHQVELADKSVRTDKIRFVFSPLAITKLRNKSNFDYIGKTSPNKMWQKICIRAGIKYRTVYQLRHTYASWMLSYGKVNIAYLAEQMGHSNFTMIAKIYGKWMEDDKYSESEKAWDKLKNIVC